MEKNLLVVIDGNSLVYRAFYAIPTLTNKEGLETNAIYGFTNMLFKIIDTYNPTHISVAFDKKSPTFRHKEYKEYKEGRKKMPNELIIQIERIKELLDAFNINRLEVDGFEADDIIGTISLLAENEGFKTIIVTGDMDAIQLVSHNTTTLITKKGITEIEEFNYNKVLEKYELTPNQFIDLKGLMGDKSDNIPGIPGIGEKIGIKLLKEYKSLENLIDNMDNIKGSQGEKVRNNISLAIMSKKLATIVRDMELDINLDELKLKEYNVDKILRLFNEFGFKTLMKRLDNFREDEEIKVEDLTIDNVEKVILKVKQLKELCIKCVIDKKNITDKNIVGIFIGVDKDIFYTDKENIFLRLKSVLIDNSIKKYGYKMKDDYIALKPYDIEMENLWFDISIAEYLIDSTSSNYEYNDIAIKYLGRQLKSEEDLLGKGKKALTYSDIDEGVKKSYFASMIDLIWSAIPIMMEKIIDLNMTGLFNNIEMPLVKVLGDMEFIGFRVDKEMLIQFQEKYTLIIDKLEKDIYNIAEEEFNINSPKQLGVILFEKLNLPIIKKTKTGYSTDADVLEALKNSHPIIAKISEYRQLIKLKSTYIDGLLNIINEKTNRIHSSFNQTITTTGRISSTEPNLQNIPIKLEMGRNLRKVFISNENHFLVDADYSQIELRILAHICMDETLLNTFLNDEDVHIFTASKVFDVSIDEVTSQMRSAAKAVNFGIVYGISDYGLSQNLNITVQKAKEYIENYFEKYPKVKQYMDDIIEVAINDGYVNTILNRRRYLPEIRSKHFAVKNFGKRLAMNTPIQGSAADIIKVAMVNVYNQLKNRGLKSKLILQVHDELIIETLEDELEEVKLILKNEMENAVDLRVKLKVDLNYGKSWYETK